MTLAVGPALAAASGVALILLGCAVLAVRPRRAHSLAVGIFGCVWGLSVIAGNATLLASNDAGIPWGPLAFAFRIVLYLPLAAILLLERRASRDLWLTGGVALVIPAAVGLLALAARPDLFLSATTRNVGGIAIGLTNLGGLVDAFAGVIIFALALLVLAFTRPRSDRSTILLAALSAYVSFRAGQVITGEAIFRLTPVGFAAGVLALAATSTALAQAVTGRVHAWRGLLIVTTTVPALVGAAEVLLTVNGTPLSTVGIWRLLTVALLCYGILRHQLFDIELKLRNATAAASYVAAAFLVLGLLAVATPILASGPAFLTLGVIGSALVAVPAARAGQALIARAAPHVGDEDYLYKRKVDVYRAALADAATRGMGKETEQKFLTELRRGLGISDAEHRILLLVVQSQANYESRRTSPMSAASQNKFEIIRELGRGTFGRALLARDRALDREVVLKQPLLPWLLDAEGRARFVDEARLAARISHPNVVIIHEVLPEDETPTIVMEHVPGGSLQSRLAQGPLAPEAARQMALGILDGLGAIHAAGIIHRDLKPANVLLARDGSPKVTDFGIARPPAEFGRAATIATQGTQPGSIAYMSPEQARGEQLDARSDLYAVGVVLYEMLTGRHYLELGGASEFHARRRIVEDEPQLPHPAISPELEPVLRRALAKQPANRFPDAPSMAAALRASIPRRLPIGPADRPPVRSHN